MLRKLAVCCALAAMAVLPTTAAASPTAGMVATIQVVNEQYKVRLVEPDDIAEAKRLLAGQSEANIPNGAIVRGSADVNTGYSWHIDPAGFNWAETTVEVCDGLPSDVERGLLDERFCPWSAKLLSLRPA